MLDPDQLDDVYTKTCAEMTRLGEDGGELFLARLALLLMKEVGDASRIEALIVAAGQDLAAAG